MTTSVMTPPTRACETHAAPASRASWCGQLRLGDVCVPVKAYAAVATPPETPLRQLHARCGQRIEYRKWCPKHGAVPPEEIVKGYPYQPDQYVQLSAEELEQLQPEDDKTIHVERFLDPSAVDLTLFAGRSLYLVPANPAAQRPFAAVHEAFCQSRKWGIGPVVFSGKRQILLVRPEGHVLMAHTLYPPVLRRALANGDVGDWQIPANELRPLRRIIDSSNGTVPWDDFQDDTDRRLAELVAAKVRPTGRRRGARSNGSARIDYYSRLVVGFCLGFEPPSYAVIMEALRHAILPKAYLKDRYPRVQGEWPCCGLPEKLVCDRGPDLTSKDLEGAAFQLGIELDFNPPRTPHLKGTVESFFDGLNDQLASSLPGRTFRSWEKRADYKPDEGPFLTYQALLEVIHIHLVDVYSMAKHPTSSTTRIEMWQDSAAVHPPSLPASTDELLVLLARRAERTLTARGIELGGMFYASDELMALRAEMAAANHHIDRLSVRYNPWDLGAVWVVSPVDGSFRQATAVDSAMQGMTEYQWKVLKRAVRERFDQPEHLLSLAAGRNAIRAVVEEALQKPSRRRRSRVMRYLQGGPAHVDEAAERPDNETVDPHPDALRVPDISSIEELPQASPAPPIDTGDIDVSDWEVASPDI